ncbi:MAG: alpha/beta hydrolase [Thermoleophilaceae bacterium]|nr:alpha/beta hydrolase [Thermoleophilaceae bacterium]
MERGADHPVEATLNHHRGGSGEPLVLIHGIGSSWQAFQPVLGALEARHDVLAVDMPGFGDSPPLPAAVRPTIGALADAVERACVAAGFDTPHVCGNSLGGWVGLELARRGRARTLVALSPGGGHNDRETKFVVASLRATHRMARTLAPLAEVLTRTAAGRTALFGQISARPWRMEPAAAAARLRTVAASPSFEATLEHTVASDRARSLGEIRCPTTIAWGTRDRLLFPRQGPRFVRAIPGARLRELPGLGHVPMFDDAEMTARAVLETTATGRANGASWAPS